MKRFGQHKSLFLKAFLILLWAAAVSAMFNERQKRLQYRKYPQIGRSVDIGGRNLNIYCLGEGSPAVVFETFAHQAGLSWNAVQEEVAKFTLACWYDRAGYGWSDEGPLPRNFKAVAEDLHTLLTAAAIPPPYVFVGAHDGASEIRVYHGRYNSDVAGIVLIDGNDLDVYAHHANVPDFMKGPWERSFGSFAPYILRSACVVLPTAQRISIVFPKFGRPRPTLSYGLRPELQAELDFLSDRAYADACDAQQNESDVLAAGNFGNRPLVVLASKRQIRGRGDAKRIQEWNDWWVNQEQSGLAALSSKGRLVVVDDRVDVPDIVRAVTEILREVRERPTSQIGP
jgi:hypothetical protein